MCYNFNKANFKVLDFCVESSEVIDNLIMWTFGRVSCSSLQVFSNLLPLFLDALHIGSLLGMPMLCVPTVHDFYRDVVDPNRTSPYFGVIISQRCFAFTSLQCQILFPIKKLFCNFQELQDLTGRVT